MTYFTVKNMTGVDIPPGSLLKLGAVEDATTQAIGVTKPDADSQDGLAVSSDTTIEAGQLGQATLDGMAVVAFNEDDTPPVAGEVWGSLADSFTLHRGKSGWMVFGSPFLGLMNARRVPSGGSGSVTVTSADGILVNGGTSYTGSAPAFSLYDITPHSVASATFITVGTTLHVIGAVTFDATLYTSGDVTFVSQLTVNSGVTFNSTLHVVGAVTFDSTLYVNSSITCSTLSAATTIHAGGAIDATTSGYPTSDGGTVTETPASFATDFTSMLKGSYIDVGSKGGGQSGTMRLEHKYWSGSSGNVFPFPGHFLRVYQPGISGPGGFQCGTFYATGIYSDPTGGIYVWDAAAGGGAGAWAPGQSTTLATGERVIQGIIIGTGTNTIDGGTF